MSITVIALIIIIFLVLVSSAMWIQWSWSSCLWFTVPYWHCMRCCCGDSRRFQVKIGSTLQMQSWCWPQNASQTHQNALRPFKIHSAVKYSSKGQKSITEACRASFQWDREMTTLSTEPMSVKLCRNYHFRHCQVWRNCHLPKSAQLDAITGMPKNPVFMRVSRHWADDATIRPRFVNVSLIMFFSFLIHK